MKVNRIEANLKIHLLTIENQAETVEDLLQTTEKQAEIAENLQLRIENQEIDEMFGIV